MCMPMGSSSLSLRFPRELYLPAGEPRPPIPSHKPSYQNERTEMCNNMIELGGCLYGEKCSFAHCVEEIQSRTLPSSYRRDLCRNFFGNGICYYGTRCRFSHSLSLAAELGWVYDPSISAYVRDGEILSSVQKRTTLPKVVDCWSTRKAWGVHPSNFHIHPRGSRPITHVESSMGEKPRAMKKIRE